MRSPVGLHAVDATRDRWASPDVNSLAGTIDYPAHLWCAQSRHIGTRWTTAPAANTSQLRMDHRLWTPLIAVLPFWSCASVSYAQLTDPAGCVIQRVAAETGVSQFQFNGVSPDGDTLGVGWSRPPKRGSYLLDLRTATRSDLPAAFDNAVSFSPDGRKLISAVNTPDRRTEILELDRSTGQTRVIGSDPAVEFCPATRGTCPRSISIRIVRAARTCT